MINIKAPKVAIQRHVDAVMARVRKTYNEASIIKEISLLNVASIEEFLTADVATMRKWVNECPELLKFKYFFEIYERYFSKGYDRYVDGDYNAYKYLDSLGATVCPYCDDEYFDTVTIEGRNKRTGEIDHFFPKSIYPALAMCFYNLIPGGQVCNGLKMAMKVGTNPYEDDIESLTWLYPDLPVGVNMETIKPELCRVAFHPKKGMIENVKLFALEQRYERHTGEAYRLLRNAQMYSEEKIDELVSLGFGTREEIISNLFGPQDPEEKRKSLRQKMLRDLTGY